VYVSMSGEQSHAQDSPLSSSGELRGGCMERQGTCACRCPTTVSIFPVARSCLIFQDRVPIVRIELVWVSRLFALQSKANLKLNF